MFTTNRQFAILYGELGVEIDLFQSTLKETKGMESFVYAKEVVACGALLKSMMPILKYVYRQIEVASSWSNHYAVNDGRVRYLRERAVSLAGGRTDSERANSDADADVVYGGTELVLTRSGQFLLLKHSGRCSQYQNGGGFWKTDVEKLSMSQAIGIYHVRNYSAGFGRQLG